jgi:YhcH/YjgK/YiaL family protein
MITSTLSNLALYKNISPILTKAIDYILNTRFEEIMPGKYEVEGEEIFYMVNEFSTKPAAECEPERHRVYTDIQFMIKGVEKFGYTAFTNQIPSTDFLPDNDVAFYNLPTDTISYITLTPAEFIIFFPTDIHQPEVFADAPMSVRKVVFKIKL